MKALVVKKRDDNDEFGIVLMNDIAKKCWRITVHLNEPIFMRL